MSTTIVILAAGRSTRMHSQEPKVMHLLSNRPALGYVIDLAKSMNPDKVILVTAPDMEEVRKFAKNEFPQIVFAIQEKALGTGDALKFALPHINSRGRTIVLYGDVPLVSTETLNILNNSEADVSLAAFYTENPNKYGRVITFNDDVIDIVEFNDANREEQAVNYCNSGIYSINNEHLHSLVHSIQNNNSKKEYYLTDIVKLATQRDLSCRSYDIEENEVLAFNTREELSILEEIVQDKIKTKLTNLGVTIILPKTSFISYDFIAGKDVTIHPNVYIGKNVTLDNDVTIHSFSHLEGVAIESGVSIGPFARIRPQTKIASKSKIGNFVEIKNSSIDSGSKISHLSYVGDTEIGKSTNIGAGAITCNYDGISKKSKTKIGNNVSIGSNTSLIAPITINDGSYIAAGSVINKEVAADDLSIARSKQVNIKDGAKVLRKKSKKDDI